MEDHDCKNDGKNTMNEKEISDFRLIQENLNEGIIKYNQSNMQFLS